MANSDRFTPPWFEKNTPAGSFRSLFKWGDPAAYKHPNQGLYALMRETFGMRDEDFTAPQQLGLEAFDAPAPVHLDAIHLDFLRDVCGEENVSTDAYTRTRVSYGCGAIDVLRLRKKIVENLPDVVVAPRDRAEIGRILGYCHTHRIPLYVFGAGSSVTRGTEAVCGGISLDMSRHMTRVLAFSEQNQTITVEAGMSGPELERVLNNAPQTLKASRAYTCGHFPQSFEYSSVGGWVVTRGAGQNSTYYGKIEDMVVSQDYATPVGNLRTLDVPRSATGPDLDQVLMGGEGCFGVLTSVTLRVCRRMPENTRRYAYLFKDWDEARAACREIMQGEFGYPSVFRLSDPEETNVAMRMYHIHGTPADTLLQALGYQPMRRCLLLGSADGDRDYTRLVTRKIGAICRRYSSFPLSPFRVTQAWEHSRFRDPYMREDLQDFGILTDTLECAVSWEKMGEVHARVRAFIKSRPQTICMTHLSHAYPQGANLYFIFIARIDQIQEYLDLQYGILEAIQQAGAAMSHHHGIGKQTGAWFSQQAGPTAMGLLQAIKGYFDPHHILNPGGTLGLDLSDAQREKRWSKDL